MIAKALPNDACYLLPSEKGPIEPTAGRTKAQNILTKIWLE